MSWPPRELLDLLYSIPFPRRRRSLLRAEHHNNVKKLLLRWMEYNLLDVLEPEVYSKVQGIPEVSEGDLVTPIEWNAVLDALKAISSMIERRLQEFCPFQDASPEYLLHLFRRYLDRLVEAEPGMLIASGQYNSRWSALANLICLNRLPIHIVRKFSLYVETTGVWKSWDYLILPDGGRVDIPPGKYHKIFSISPLVFGLEDLTEEIGEPVDWDFDEPKIEVLSITSCEPFHGTLQLTWEAVYTNQLYYNGNYIIRFRERGETTIQI